MPKKVAVCPISLKHIDEHVARLNCFVSFILAIVAWFYPLVWLFLFVSFFLRAYLIEWSLVYRLNQLIVKLLALKPQYIDRAPKLFAAKIGLFMTVLINLFAYLHLTVAMEVSFAFLLFATFIASVFNYCLGCKLYALLVNLGLIKLAYKTPKAKRKRVGRKRRRR